MRWAPVALAAVLLAAAPGAAQRRGADPGEAIDMRFREARLSDVVLSVARATGERFLFDETLHGFVTIMVPAQVGREEALEILNVALLSAGFVAVPTPGGVRKIVPLRDVGSTAPLAPLPQAIGSDAPITTMVRLQNAEAEEIASELLPYAGESSQLVAYPPSNGLILAGSELRLQRLLTLIRALDASAEETVLVIRLRHRDAEDLAEDLRAVHSEGEVLGDRFVFRADPRTNSLIMRAPRDRIGDVRASIAILDQPRELRTNLEILRVRYSQPDELAELLRGLASGAGGPAGESSPEASLLRGLEFTLAVDAPSRTLLMAGEPRTLALLRQVVDEIDIEPRRVFVELMVLEITAEESLELSLDGFYNFAAGGAFGTVVTNPSGGGFVQPGAGGPAGAGRYQGPTLLIPFLDLNGNPTVLEIPRELATVTAEERQIAARVLLRPHLLVASGEEQQIFAGNNLPVPVESAAAEGAVVDPLQVRTNIERRDVGLTLRVLPTLGAEGGIRVELFAETTRLAEPLAGSVERVGPTLESRAIETVLSLVDGIWELIGVGHQPELSEQETGVPWVKDIPLLGNLFRSTDRRRLTNHLVIAVRALVVPNAAELEAESIRRRLAFQRSVVRLTGLDPERDGAVLLLVTTRDLESDARALADAFEAGAYTARVVPWEWEGATYHDVYLTGFASIPDAAEAVLPLRAEGWRPEIVPLPGATPEPDLLHERAESRVPDTAPF